MKVGDMVSWHDTAARKFRNGIIVEKLTQDEVIKRFGTGEIFVVLWNTGQLIEHKRWELRRINESR